MFSHICVLGLHNVAVSGTTMVCGWRFHLHCTVRVCVCACACPSAKLPLSGMVGSCYIVNQCQKSNMPFGVSRLKGEQCHVAVS